MSVIYRSNIVQALACLLTNKSISHHFLKVLGTQKHTLRYESSGIIDDEDYSPNYNRRGAYIGNSHEPTYRPRYSNNQANRDRYSNEQNSLNDQRNYRFNRPSYHSNDFKRPSYSNNNFGKNLLKPTFHNLPSVEKNFYIEHPEVTDRSLEEVDDYRKTLNICVKGIEVPKPITKFSELHLPGALTKVMEEQGYSDPTPIQCQGWPLALSGRDVIGISQTGSGKTLVFMVPSIIHATNNSQMQNRSQTRRSKPRVLVLAPTRELVQQIHDVGYQYIVAGGLRSACAYGGSSKGIQLRNLQGADICIATPGRLIDFLSEGSVSLEQCTYLVLDEADRMLDMGFEPQIRKIVNQTRPDRQTLMWSATWPREIQSLAHDFLSNYVQITVGSEELVANPNIEQNIYIVQEEHKREKILSLLESITSEEQTKVLVFAQTKRMVDSLGYHLEKLRIPVLCIHGDISQYRRNQVLHDFRKLKSCILIATDVAARGLDITDIRHVVNYDFPTNIEDYIHRIGRTARGVQSGIAHSLFTPQNVPLVPKLIRVLKQSQQHIDPELYTIANHNRRNRSPYQNDRFERRQYAA